MIADSTPTTENSTMWWIRMPTTTSTIRTAERRAEDDRDRLRVLLAGHLPDRADLSDPAGRWTRIGVGLARVLPRSLAEPLADPLGAFLAGVVGGALVGLRKLRAMPASL